MHVVLFYGSVRPHRKGIRLVKYFLRNLEARGHQATLMDPMELKLPMLEYRYSDYDPGKAPEVLERMASTIRNADGFLVVTAEYNHSLPPALTNTMDHFFAEYFYKPSAIACYSGGNGGGNRAAMQARAFLAEIGCPTIPTVFSVRKIQDTFDAKGNPSTPGREERYGRFLDRFLTQFEWHMEAFAAQRAKGIPD